MNKAKAARKPKVDANSQAARDYHMAKDAGEAAIIREATIQAKADKVKAEKALADKVKAEKAEANETKAANNGQAKAKDNGRTQDGGAVRLVKSRKG